MRCENVFCVYWHNDECRLNEISLNVFGTCECCIYVDIDERLLKKRRAEFLEKDDKIAQSEEQNKTTEV